MVDERGEVNSILSGITHLQSTGCIMNGIAARQQHSIGSYYQRKILHFY